MYIIPDVKLEKSVLLQCVQNEICIFRTQYKNQYKIKLLEKHTGFPIRAMEIRLLNRSIRKK